MNASGHLTQVKASAQDPSVPNRRCHSIRESSGIFITKPPLFAWFLGLVKKIIIQLKIGQRYKKIGLKSTGAQQFPQKNLGAGDKWLAEEKNARFTLQLMVLAADQAGEKLRRIMGSEAGQKGSNNFIVLRKAEDYWQIGSEV